MAAKSQVADQATEVVKNVPAVTQHAVPPAGLAEELEGQEGLGTSSLADDNIVPFLALLQDMSPEVKKRDSAYIEGAEPGCLFNKATRQLWTPEKSTGIYVNGDGEPLEIQPCAFQRAIIQWIPRDSGGGMAGRFEHSQPTIEESMIRAGGKQILDPRDTSGRKTIWKASNGTDDLIDTRYHYVQILLPDGGIQPVVMSFSSTGHTSSRAWMALQRNAILRNSVGTPRVAPAWFKKYHVRAAVKSNPSGEWFVLSFEDLGNAGWVADAGVRAVGRQLYESVNSGVMRAAAEEPTDGGSAGRSRDDIPI